MPRGTKGRGWGDTYPKPGMPKIRGKPAGAGREALSTLSPQSPEATDPANTQVFRLPANATVGLAGVAGCPEVSALSLTRSSHWREESCSHSHEK